MTFNNINKLLAGTLALVLVAGMTSPAFAGNNIHCDITQNPTVDVQIPANGEIIIPKIIVCDFQIVGANVLATTCVLNDISLNGEVVGNSIIYDETITNLGNTSEEHCEQGLIINDAAGSVVIVTQEIWINRVVAGELLPLDNTALFLAGLSSMSVWMIPAVAGLAGAGVYLVKFRKQ